MNAISQEKIINRINELTKIRDEVLAKFHSLTGAISELQYLLTITESTDFSPVENKE